MAREITVNLGGAERRLLFSATRDGIALQTRFKKKPGQLIDEDIAPATIVEESGRRRRIPTGYYSPEPVAVALWLGMRHDPDLRKLTEEDVFDWMDQATATPAGMKPIIAKLFDALLLSGIGGRSVDLEAVRQALRAEEDGKAPAPEGGDGDAGKEAAPAAVSPSENP